jgi:hypothetical protein
MTSSSSSKKSLVNYVMHLNAVRARFKNDRRLKPGHISLYYVLFHTWNERRFQNPINVYREEAMDETGIGNQNTYARCLSQLGEWGYIRYTPDSKSSRGSIIHMIAFDAPAATTTKAVPGVEGYAEVIVQTGEQSTYQPGIVSDTTADTRDQLKEQAREQVKHSSGITSDTGSDTEGDTRTPITPYYNKNTINNINVNGVNGTHTHEPIVQPSDLNKKKSAADISRPAGTRPPPYAGAAGGRRAQNIHEVTRFFAEVGGHEDHALQYYRHHEANDWTEDRSGLPVADWKARAWNWMREDPFKRLRNPFMR